jgi:putative ABC transport system ATP-binding protein
METSAAAEASAPMVLARDVVKRYPPPAGVGADSFAALHGLNLTVHPGEFVAVMGKSGAGKTTLINLLAGTDSLTSGCIEVAGVQPHRLRDRDLAQWRGRTLGIIYQSFHLMPNLSLLDNILLPMELCGLYRGRSSRARAAQLLTDVGLEAHMYKLPSATSGGQQQRAAIARALANDPPLLLADEPTGRLDSVTAESVFAIFQRLAAAGKTVLMVTHDLGLALRCDRALHLVDGRITAAPLEAV